MSPNKKYSVKTLYIAYVFIAYIDISYDKYGTEFTL